MGLVAELHLRPRGVDDFERGGRSNGIDERRGEERAWLV
jgi:hypothetical protein